MPEYSFACVTCGHRFDKTLPISQHAEPQACPECVTGSVEQLIGDGVGMVLKGDVWPGKNIRIRNQMADRRAAVGRRELQLKMDGPGIRLVPNVGGERVDSWDEAQRLAASKGKNTATYGEQKRNEVSRKQGKT